MSIKPIEFTPMPLPEGRGLGTREKIDARMKSINDAMGVPESSQRSESKPVEFVDSKTGKNDANDTWVTAIWFSNGHKVSYESRDKWTSINEAQALARDYMKSLTPEEAGEVVENDDEGWKLYTYRNLTNGMLETKLVDCYGNGYFGHGKTKSESQTEAVRVYKKYQLNGIQPNITKTETSTLASDIHEQQKVMAGLIEKAKRSGIDGRLIAMANTDFERGFMALDKALTTNKG